MNTILFGILLISMTILGNLFAYLINELLLNLFPNNKTYNMIRLIIITIVVIILVILVFMVYSSIGGSLL